MAISLRYSFQEGPVGMVPPGRVLCMFRKSKFLIFWRKLEGPLTRGGEGGEGVSPLAAEIR